jgi:tryptophan synthase beta chain
VLGREAREQHLQLRARLPEAVIACVGGGSNAMGMFFPFLHDEAVQLYGVEAGGRGATSGDHAATLSCGSPGILHGMMSYLLQTSDGQISPVHSISAGLDYPGVGPEHAYLKESGRVQYTSVTDDAALEAMKVLSRTEGIIPALESAHAIAFAMQLTPKMSPSESAVVCLSGRGDKDMETVARVLNF